MNELSNLRSISGVNSNQKILDLQKQLQQVNSQYQQVKKELQDIENISKAQGSASNFISSAKLGSTTSITLNTSSTFNKPNVLWGFVKDENNKPVTETVVIVKNFRGEPVRAVKTNSLGQFNLTTPLSNGKYLVEVSGSNKLGLTFDTLSIEASGNVIPSMEFIGHHG
jgi:DNA repair exonuclease SbcCD ATPase subunit